MVDIAETLEDCHDSCIYILEDSLDGQSFCFGEGELSTSCTAQPLTSGLQKIIQEANESKGELEIDVADTQLKKTSLKRITSVFDMIQESIVSSEAEQEVCSELIMKVEKISKLMNNETRDLEAAVSLANSLENIRGTNNECSTSQQDKVELRIFQATKIILHAYIEIDVSDVTSMKLLLVFERIHIAAVSALNALLSNINTSTSSSSASRAESSQTKVTDVLFSTTTPISSNAQSTTNYNPFLSCSTGRVSFFNVSSQEKTNPYLSTFLTMPSHFLMLQLQLLAALLRERVSL